MSIEALNWALNYKLEEPAQKAVLIGIANHANPNGEAWPSIDRLALYSGFAESTVRRAIKALVASGLLTVNEREGRSHVYRLIQFKGCQDDRGVTVTGVSPRQGRGVTVTPEPLRTIIPQKKDRHATRLPSDWQPSEALLAWVSTEFPQIEVTHEAAQFRDYWLASGGTKLDWSAAFRTWIRRARPMGAARPSPVRHSPATMADANRDKLRRLLGDMGSDEAIPAGRLIEGQRVR